MSYLLELRLVQDPHIAASLADNPKFHNLSLSLYYSSETKNKLETVITPHPPNVKKKRYIH